jgi:NAD(P)-dependent dehydrogenase (short-subunit alcohol dehydrogenase family)
MESPAGKSELMNGKIVVITGGASGIGQAAALAFAREGAGVVIGDTDIAGAENTVATIRNMGGEADCLRVDVAKSADVQPWSRRLSVNMVAWILPSTMPAWWGRLRAS